VRKPLLFVLLVTVVITLLRCRSISIIGVAVAIILPPLSLGRFHQGSHARHSCCVLLELLRVAVCNQIAHLKVDAR
jgi:hypothetical protein